MHMIYYMNTQCSICYNIASYCWVCWVSRKPNPKSLCQSSTLPTLPIVFVVEGSRFSVLNTSCSISVLIARACAIRSGEDMNCLQSDLHIVEQWCKEWRMDFNQSKCGVLKVTRNVNPIEFITI